MSLLSFSAVGIGINFVSGEEEEVCEVDMIFVGEFLSIEVSSDMLSSMWMSCLKHMNAQRKLVSTSHSLFNNDCLKNISYD